MLIFGLVSLKVSPGTNEVVERLRVLFFAMGQKKSGTCGSGFITH